MTMTSFVRRVLRVLAAGCALALVVPHAYGFQQPDKQEILKKARSAYYSLKTEGLAGFECNMTPNWAALLGEMQTTDPAKFSAAVEKLSKLQFTVKVDADGSAKVAHNEIAAENDEVAKGLSQIYSGMEQMTTGFFQTWAVFVVNVPLPEPGSDFDLQTSPEQYSLAYKEGTTTDIAVSMSRDFSISAVKVKSSGFDSNIRPQFARTAKGYLLNGYDAEYQGTGGADKTELQVALENQQVAGLHIPQKLNLKGSYNGSPFQVEVTFSGCTATRR